MKRFWFKSLYCTLKLPVFNQLFFFYKKSLVTNLFMKSVKLVHLKING